MTEVFESLSTGPNNSLDPFLSRVGEDMEIAETKAVSRCHFLKRDGNGRPVVDRLAKKIAMQAIQYCIPRTRLQEAKEDLDNTGQWETVAKLQSEARNLFTDLDTSGEGGEMLLYLLLESELGLPQLLCKMPKKTNSQVHYHGVDGIHGSLDAQGQLGLYWCESKLHGDVNKAIRECFDSLAPFLLDEGSGASERDLLLVREHLDTGDPKLTEALKRYLDDDSEEASLRVIKGASLVGFSLEEYPNPFSEDGDTIIEEVSAQIQKWFDAAGRRIKKRKIETFEIEIFCLPVPSVEDFRKAIKSHLAL